MGTIGYAYDDQHAGTEVQPTLLGLMDGSVSTLAPIFTTGLPGKPLDAF